MTDPTPAWPVDNTHRLVVNYAGVMGARSLLLRFSTATTLEVAIETANRIMADMAPALHVSVAVTGGDWYPQGSHFSVPVTLDPVVGGANTALNPHDYPKFISVTGRDSGGTRVKYTLYGIPALPDESDYRISAAQGGPLYAFRTSIGEEINLGTLVTVSGSSPNLNRYVNLGYNAYYQRKARRTG